MLKYIFIVFVLHKRHYITFFFFFQIVCVSYFLLQLQALVGFATFKVQCVEYSSSTIYCIVLHNIGVATSVLANKIIVIAKRASTSFLIFLEQYYMYVRLYS